MAFRQRAVSECERHQIFSFVLTVWKILFVKFCFVVKFYRHRKLIRIQGEEKMIIEAINPFLVLDEFPNKGVSVAQSNFP